MRALFCIIIFSQLLWACDDPERYNIAPNEFTDYITIRGCDSVLADGATLCLLSFGINEKAKMSARGIKVSVTAGTFPDSQANSISLVANDSSHLLPSLLVAETAYKSTNRVQTATVTAEIAKGIFVKKQIKLTRAYPESIKVEPDSLSFNNGQSEEIILKAKISRSVGVPSTGQKIFFTATTENGELVLETRQGVGIFRLLEQFSNETGEARVIFTLGDNSYNGTLYVKAYTLVPSDNQSNLVIPDSTKIIIY